MVKSIWSGAVAVGPMGMFQAGAQAPAVRFEAASIKPSSPSAPRPGRMGASVDTSPGLPRPGNPTLTRTSHAGQAEVRAGGENIGDRRLRPRGAKGLGASAGNGGRLGTEPSVPAFSRTFAGTEGGIREKLGLKQLIEGAYALEDYQVLGGPGWIDSARFDVEAKPAGRAGRDQPLPMLRALLADRFQLDHAEKAGAN